MKVKIVIVTAQNGYVVNLTKYPSDVKEYVFTLYHELAMFLEDNLNIKKD
jgi:hypothetical protein